jgi:hypothetical protein
MRRQVSFIRRSFRFNNYVQKKGSPGKDRQISWFIPNIMQATPKKQTPEGYKPSGVWTIL